MSGPFQLPGHAWLSRSGRPPVGAVDPVCEPAKVPEPLGSIVAALDQIEQPAEWYTTEGLAGLIGWPIDDIPRLGAKLAEVMKSPARNLPRSLDPFRRKGRRVAELRECATRYRFDL